MERLDKIVGTTVYSVRDARLTGFGRQHAYTSVETVRAPPNAHAYISDTSMVEVNLRLGTWKCALAPELARRVSRQRVEICVMLSPSVF